MTLYQLCQDKALLQELKDYFLMVLRERAIDKVFSTGEAHAVKEAKEIVDEAFENIELQFNKKDKPKVLNNEAR